MKEVIDITNYEAFWLDYIEGNLSKEDESQLFCFLELNPELKKELDDDLPILEEESIHFKDKELLYRSFSKNSSLKDKEIDGVMIAHVEGLLTEDESTELKAESKKLEWVKKDLKYFEATRLSPDLSIKFNEKSKLKKEGRVIPMVARWSVGAAAAIALMITVSNIVGAEEDSGYSLVYQPRTQGIDQGIELDSENVKVDFIASAKTKQVIEIQSKIVDIKKLNKSSQILQIDSSSRHEENMFLASEVTGEIEQVFYEKAKLVIDDDRMFASHDFSIDETSKRGLFSRIKNSLSNTSIVNRGLGDALAFGKRKVSKGVNKALKFEKAYDEDGVVSSWAFSIGRIKITHNKLR